MSHHIRWIAQPGKDRLNYCFELIHQLLSFFCGFWAVVKRIGIPDARASRRTFRSASQRLGSACQKCRALQHRVRSDSRDPVGLQSHLSTSGWFLPRRAPTWSSGWMPTQDYRRLSCPDFDAFPGRFRKLATARTPRHRGTPSAGQISAFDSALKPRL